MAKGPTSLGETDHLSYRHVTYAIDLKVGVTIEDALMPEFWAHVGKKLKPLDRIILQAPDRAFIAETIVLSAGPGFAKIKVLVKHELVNDIAALEDEEAGESPYIIKWDSPATKWAVIRKSDRVKLKVGLASKEDAHLYAATHQRAV